VTGDNVAHVLVTLSKSERKWMTCAGFDWSVDISLRGGKDKAGVYVSCHLPIAFKADDASVKAACSGELVPMRAKLVVNRWVPSHGGGEAELQAEEVDFDPREDFVAVGWSRGTYDALPLQPAGAAGPLSLERWAEYLRDGKLSGSLTWLREEGSESKAEGAGAVNS
jgi:hypothetical protein